VEKVHESEICKLVDEISQYLAAHPEASDSQSGIRQWWLNRHLRNRNPDLLDAALAHMVRHGAMQRIDRYGQEAIYRKTADLTDSSRMNQSNDDSCS
jgi:hypothetical protein